MQEWLTCAATSQTLLGFVSVGASLNAKTVVRLMSEFQTLYVLVNMLGYLCLVLFLLRETPAKMVAFSLAAPSFLLAGFLDAYHEGGRVGNSRVFLHHSFPSSHLGDTFVQAGLVHRLHIRGENVQIHRLIDGV